MDVGREVLQTVLCHKITGRDSCCTLQVSGWEITASQCLSSCLFDLSAAVTGLC